MSDIVGDGGVISNFLETESEEIVDRINDLKEELELYQQKSGSKERPYKAFRDVFGNIEYYVKNLGDVSEEEGEAVAKKVSVFLTIITNVGMVAAVLMSAFVGIKYMLSSLEEKAEYKQDIIPYIVGSILLFGICTIVKVLYSIGSSINNI